MPELSLPEPQIVMPPSLKGSLRAMPEVSAAVPPKLIESSDIPGYNDNMWGDNEQTAVITQLQNEPLNVAKDVISTPMSTERRYPRKKISKLGAGVLIGLASLAPGKGLIDRVEDPFVDGGDAVTGMLSSDRVETDGDVIYNMLHSEHDSGYLRGAKSYAAFNEMSPAELEEHKQDILEVAKNQKQDFVGETLEENEQRSQGNLRSATEVSKVFSEMDAGNLSAIDAQSKEVIDAHPEQYMTEIEAHNVAEAINNATTHQELLDAISPTLNAYGKTLDISAVGDDITYARQYSSAILDVIAVLPRGLVRDDMKFSKFVITAEEDAVNSSLAGKYQPASSPEDQTITLIANRSHNTESAIIKSNSLRDVVAHEMTHSLQDGPRTADIEGSGTLRTGEYFIDYMFGSPDETSIYGMRKDIDDPYDGHEETRADIGGDTFTGGYNTPDDVRQFTSLANKDRLQLMQYVEAKYPGSTAVLVSRTMEKVATINKEDLLQYLAYFGAVYAFLAPTVKSMLRRRRQ